jgi:hypothetical protein
MGSGPIAEDGDYVHGMLFGYLSVLEFSFIAHAVLACVAVCLVVGRIRGRRVFWRRHR